MPGWEPAEGGSRASGSVWDRTGQEGPRRGRPGGAGAHPWSLEASQVPAVVLRVSALDGEPGLRAPVGRLEIQSRLSGLKTLRDHSSGGKHKDLHANIG